jgi:hypothetical protein
MQIFFKITITKNLYIVKKKTTEKERAKERDLKLKAK